MSTELLVPLAFFAMIFGICYVFFTTRNRERLAMIEKGADMSLFRQQSNGKSALKFGLLFIGAAIGILAGNILHYAAGMEEGAAFVSMILLFGGAGLLTFYLIQRREAKPSGPEFIRS